MDRLSAVLQKYDFSLTDKAVAERVKMFLADAPKNMQKSVFSNIVGMVGVTSLHSQDTDESISALVGKINGFDDKFEILPHPAAICIYPEFVSLVKSLLTEDVEIAAVAGGFPHSRTFTEVKIAEVSMCVAEGATEIDVVMPVGKMLDGRFEEIYDELSELKAACRDARLKVILETSLLHDAETIKQAAVIAMVSGADFIKTSTGKDGQCATPEAVYVMCNAIAEFNKLNKTKVGIKIAGGVSTTASAVDYYTLVQKVLGDEWLTPELMRFGASRLLNSLLTSIVGDSVVYF